MTRVYVGMGSNIAPEVYVPSALSALRRRYGDIEVSSVYESVPVGMQGNNFINLVVSFETDQDIRVLARSLREIERRHGRRRGPSRFEPRTLDLDLLLYGSLVLQGFGFEVPRKEILTDSHVLCPLAEIAGNLRHPVLGRRYAELWEELSRHHEGQQIWRVFSHQAQNRSAARDESSPIRGTGTSGSV